MKPKSFCYYGPPGGGKTTLAVSSFFDIMKEKVIEGRKGRWLLIGREENDALGVPEECIKRFPLPEANPIAFVKEFTQYLANLRAAASKGTGPTDIVIDSWTELNYMFTWGYKKSKQPRDKWEIYREWLDTFLGSMLTLHPKELNANIFGIARVGEFRSGSKTSRGDEIKGDPEYMADFKYTPLMEGQAKYLFGHYFNFIVYLEGEYKEVKRKGKDSIEPIHKSFWLPQGDFRVKNIFEHKWLKRGLPPMFENISFPEVEQLLTELETPKVKEVSSDA